MPEEPKWLDRPVSRRDLATWIPLGAWAVGFVMGVENRDAVLACFSGFYHIINQTPIVELAPMLYVVFTS